MSVRVECKADVSVSDAGEITGMAWPFATPGVVLDDDVITRAAEIDKKFGLVSVTISSWIQPKVISFLNDVLDLMDRVKPLDTQQDSTLDAQLASIGKRRLDIENEIKRLQNGDEKPDDGILGTSWGASTSLEMIDDLKRENDALAENERRILDVVKARQKASETVLPGIKLPPAGMPVTPGSGGTGGKAVDSFDKLNDAVNRFVDHVVKAESGGDANAKNPNSSATGVGQFIESTWLDLFRKNFPDRAKSMSDQTILALRSDAEISRTLIEAYARENANVLRQAGVGVNEMALQMAHFLGPQGAVKILQAAPSTPVSQLLDSKAIKANPTILGYGATAGDVVRYAQQRTQALQGEKNAVGELGDAWGGLRATTADANAQMTQDVNRIADAEREFVGGFAHDLMNGVAPLDALRNAVSRLADTLIDDLLDSIFRVKSAGGGGGGGFLSSIFGGLFGGGTSSFIPGILSGGLVGLFAEGGQISGPGTGTSDSIPAMLSAGEYVVRASQARKHGALLAAINSGRVSHFAHGGSVGGAGSTPLVAANGNSNFAPTINVNVEGGSRGPEADDAMGKTIAKQLEGTMRGLISDEMRRATRPGALANNRSR